MSSKSENFGSLSNPFLASFSLHPTTKYTEWEVKGSSTGMITSFSVPRLIDYSEGSWYSNMRFDELHSYSKAALQILGYILHHLRWNQDYIEIKYYTHISLDNPNRLVMSKTNFYKGINELTRRNVIVTRASRKSTYWINPSMLFKGNRLTAFPDYIVKPSTDAQ